MNEAAFKEAVERTVISSAIESHEDMFRRFAENYDAARAKQPIEDSVLEKAYNLFLQFPPCGKNAIQAFIVKTITAWRQSVGT